MSHLNNLTLRIASPVQVTESRRRTHDEWSRGLSMDQYLHLNALLDRFEHALEKLTTWVLVPREDPFTLDFLCSCETYRRTALFRNDTVVQEVTAYAIASVFTPAANRGQGFASHMLRLLHHVLASENDLPPFPPGWGDRPLAAGFGDARLSVLYSDVGPKFYASCGPSISSPGWKVQGAHENSWPVNVLKRDPDVSWRPLELPRLEEYLRRDAELIRQEITKQSGNQFHNSCSFTGDNGLNNFLVQRALAFATLENRCSLEVWGAVLSAGGEDVGLATWIFPDERRSESLIITRLRFRNTSDLEVLLHAASAVATEHGLKEIVAWGLSAKDTDAALELGGAVRTRSHHLPALCVYGVDEEVEWLHNEMFAWC